MHGLRDQTSSQREPSALPPRFEPRIELHIEPIPRSSDDAAGEHSTSPRRLAVYWGLGGFLLGIAFWHGVGFWQLMQRTISTENQIEETRSAAAPQPAPTPGTLADTVDRALASISTEQEPAGITTGAVPPPAGRFLETFNDARADAASAKNCVSFTKDRVTGEVHGRPCSNKERTLPHNPNSERENLAQQSASGNSRWPLYTAPSAAD